MIAPRSRHWCLAATTVLLLLVASPPGANAHQLNVFAYLEGREIIVEARFSSGRVARNGEVRVFDGNDVLVGKARLNEDGMARFPLAHHERGLKFEVSAPDGHSGYWILTPQDIARQTGGQP